MHNINLLTGNNKLAPVSYYGREDAREAMIAVQPVIWLRVIGDSDGEQRCWVRKLSDWKEV